MSERQPGLYLDELEAWAAEQRNAEAEGRKVDKSLKPEALTNKEKADAAAAKAKPEPEGNIVTREAALAAKAELDAQAEALAEEVEEVDAEVFDDLVADGELVDVVKDEKDN